MVTAHFARSDVIRLSDGSRVQGTILNATPVYIAVETEGTKTVQITHNQIESITFIWADVVHLTNREKLICKIANQTDSSLIVATESGVRQIPHSDVAMYFYQRSQNLEIPELPATGELFKNQRELTAADIRYRAFFGLTGGAQWPPLNKWKQSFLGGVWNFSGGLKAGLYIRPSLIGYIGLHIDLYSHNYDEDIRSRYNSLYLHGGLQYTIRLNKKPFTLIYFGADAGLFRVAGDIYLYSFRPVHLSDQSIACRPFIGLRTFMTNTVSLNFETGYLIANSGPFQHPVQELDDFGIPFSGFCLLFNALFHID